jgi:hypothetical protein
MFGLSAVAALAISKKVARVPVSCPRQSEPPVAGLARINAQLQEIRDQVPGLTAAARDAADLEQVMAHTCARIEEWTA